MSDQRGYQPTISQIQAMNDLTQQAIALKRNGNFVRALETYNQIESLIPAINPKTSISKAKVLVLLERKGDAINGFITGIGYFAQFDQQILGSGDEELRDMCISAIEYYAFCMKEWPDEESVLARLKGFESGNLGQNVKERYMLGLAKLKKMGIWCNTFDELADKVKV